MSDYQDQTEQAISDARGLFSALYDEYVPDMSGTFEARDNVNDRLMDGMRLLDEASDTLREVGWERDKVEDALFEAQTETARLNDVVEASSLSNLALDLLHELEGRRMTDSPIQVVWWIEHALRELATQEVGDPGDTGVLVNTILRMGA